MRLIQRLGDVQRLLHVRPNCLEHTSCSVPRSNGSGGPSRTRSVSTDTTWALPAARMRSNSLLGNRLLQAAAGVVSTTLRRRPTCDEGLAGIRQRDLDGPERHRDKGNLAVAIHHQLQRRRLHPANRQHAGVAGLASEQREQSAQVHADQPVGRERARAE